MGTGEGIVARGQAACCLKCADHINKIPVMDKKKNGSPMDPEQRKWDDAGPGQASGRTGGHGGDYNEGRQQTGSEPGSIREGKFGKTETGPAQEGLSESLGGPGGGTNAPSTREERRFGGSHTAGTPLRQPDGSEWKGGTPEQGPTSGGMGAAGGGHDTDENDVWDTKDHTDK